MKYLSSIQILRGFAALAITFAHTHSEVEWWAAYLHYDNPMPGLVTGAAGVDLFFVISGFVMVYTNADSFGSLNAPGDFLLRRIIRIVPLYWLATFLFLTHMVFIGQSWIGVNLTDKNVLCSLFFVPCLRPNGTWEPALTQGWSLDYEMFFYLCFAAIMLLPRRIGIPCLVAALTYAAYRGVPFTVPHALLFLINTMLLEFIFGVLIGWACVEKIPVPQWLATAAVALGVLGLLACAIFDLETMIDRPWRWGLPCALIVFGMVFRPDVKGWKPLKILGDISYSLYLFHGFVMIGVHVAVSRLITPLAYYAWVYAAFLVIVSVAASYIIYVVIERPVTRWLQKRVEDNSTGKDTSCIRPSDMVAHAVASVGPTLRSRIDDDRPLKRRAKGMHCCL
jgi:exopolysaccharide production protein ExoZ